MIVQLDGQFLREEKNTATFFSSSISSNTGLSYITIYSQKHLEDGKIVLAKFLKSKNPSH